MGVVVLVIAPGRLIMAVCVMNGMRIGRCAEVERYEIRATLRAQGGSGLEVNEG
jgi:hypothetical protein